MKLVVQKLRSMISWVCNMLGMEGRNDIALGVDEKIVQRSSKTVVDIEIKLLLILSHLLSRVPCINTSASATSLPPATPVQFLDTTASSPLKANTTTSPRMYEYTSTPHHVQLPDISRWSCVHSVRNRPIMMQKIRTWDLQDTKAWHEARWSLAGLIV
jgi:hypothetical protein